MKDFICLESIGKEQGQNRSCGNLEKQMSALEKKIHKEINIVVFAQEVTGCREHVAQISENYDLATIDPSVIFVRKKLADTLETVDFSSIAHLFLEEKQFAAYEHDRENGKSSFPKQGSEVSCAASIKTYDTLFAQVKERFGEILPFFQNMVFQDMLPLFFSKEDTNAPFLRQILQFIEDDILCGASSVDADVLLKILALKYDKDIEGELLYRSGKLKYHNLPTVLLKEVPFIVEEIRIIKGRFNIKGRVIIPLRNSDIEYYVMDNKNKRYEISFEKGGEISFLGEALSSRKRFQVSLPIGKNPVGMRFMYRYQKRYQARVRMEFDEKVGITADSERNFCACDGYFLKEEKRILFASPLRVQTRVKLFFTFLRKSIKIGK